MSINREDLEKQALQAVCACYYYDMADTIDSLTNEELTEIIAEPYKIHEMNDPEELDECPQYQQEKAEAIRDGLREDGNV